MKQKFLKRHWQIIRYYVEGWSGELHHLVRGQKQEALNLIMPLSVFDHRGDGHAKNWFDAENVPTDQKVKAHNFWLNTMSEEDVQYFIDTGYSWL